MSPYADLLDRAADGNHRPRLLDHQDLADCLTQYPHLVEDLVLNAAELAQALADGDGRDYIAATILTQLARDANNRIDADLQERFGDRVVNAYADSVMEQRL